MHDIVRQSFASFLQPMEGKETCMYQDHLGLVTTGVGNKIDSPEQAWDLPRRHGVSWLHRHDRSVEASHAEVVAEWHRVKNDATLRRDVNKARETAQLVLSEQGVFDLLQGVLRDYESTLTRHGPFSRLDDWPADAQLSLFSMAWAMGPGFGPGWPKFSAAVDGPKPQWREALQHCNMVNSWMMRRNAVSRGLFRNADWATTEQQAFDRLYVAIPGRRPVVQKGDTDATHAGQGFDSDESVSDLQGFLEYLGFDIDVTGTFDQTTDDAVQGFQLFEKTLDNNHDFVVDGKVGLLSWAALGYVVSSR